MRAKIIRLSKKDAHYDDRKDVLGLVGDVTYVFASRAGGWKAIAFIPDNNPWNNIPTIYFYSVRIEEVKNDKPS